MQNIIYKNNKIKKNYYGNNLYICLFEVFNHVTEKTLDDREDGRMLSGFTRISTLSLMFPKKCVCIFQCYGNNQQLIR